MILLFLSGAVIQGWLGVQMRPSSNRGQWIVGSWLFPPDHAFFVVANVLTAAFLIVAFAACLKWGVRR